MIARNTAAQLDLGTHIFTSEYLPLLDAETKEKPENLAANYGDLCLAADGFAQVYPEHKYLIVECLRELGYAVGMTGTLQQYASHLLLFCSFEFVLVRIFSRDCCSIHQQQETELTMHLRSSVPMWVLLLPIPRTPPAPQPTLCSRNPVFRPFLTVLWKRERSSSV